MGQICTTSPLPSFTDLYKSFEGLFKAPEIDLPDLPTFGKKSLGAVQSPEMFLINWIQAFQQSCMIAVVKIVVDPISKILGGSIDDLLPHEPFLGLPFTKLINISPDDLYDAIKKKYNEVKELIPSPIFQGFTTPDMELPELAKSLLVTFFASIVKKLTELISKVTDILEIPGLGKLPTIPTRAEVQKLITDFIKEHKVDFNEAVRKVFPIFPDDIIPTSFPPTIASPEMQLTHGIGILMTELTILPLKIIADFIKKILGASFPPICIPVPDLVSQ